MKRLRTLLLIALIISLVMGSAFAKNDNSRFKVGELSEESEKVSELVVTDFLNKQMKNGDFRIKTKYLDGKSMTTLRVDQYFNNTKIIGADLVLNVHNNGVVKSFVGEIINLEGKLSKQIKKNTNKSEAIEIALKDLQLSPELLEMPKPQVVVYKHDGTYMYAYELELLFDEPTPGRWYYYVNTATGEVVNKMNLNNSGKPVSFVESNTVVGTGTDVLGNVRDFNTNYSKGSYYLVDLTRGNGINTYNAKNRTRLPGSYWSDDDNIYNASYDAAAVSSQFYFGVTYDYYLNKFNRNSFDNNGALIKSTVHVGKDYNNAYWNGRQFAFGDGDGSYFIALSGSLDVVAHEFTHAVTEYTAGLIYQNESGALNEAISDIMGVAVEFYLNENPDWLLGEDIAGPGLVAGALRSLKDPTAMGDPDHYSNIYTGSEDNGGVHSNSGVINKVAYLIGAGGSHYGTHVQAQGVDAMEDIFYRALTTYMTSGTDFSGARQASIQAATDLYGSNSSQVQSVIDAYSACGIY